MSVREGIFNPLIGINVVSNTGGHFVSNVGDRFARPCLNMMRPDKPLRVGAAASLLVHINTCRSLSSEIT